MAKMTFTDLQTSLMNAGFALPKYGADGFYGTETANAVSAFAESGKAIDVVAEGTPAPPSVDIETIVPADWMPDCLMNKIIVHWTAGAYKASENDREHYHILVEGDGRLIKGKYSIKANVSISDADGYAAHTKNCNTGAIGVSACAMAGASESPFHTGQYPLLEDQYLTVAHVVADLCNKYDIPVDKTHVMSHGNVQANLSIAQEGKWDVCKFPWNPSLNAQQADEWFRGEVKKFM